MAEPHLIPESHLKVLGDLIKERQQDVKYQGYGSIVPRAFDVDGLTGKVKRISVKSLIRSAMDFLDDEVDYDDGRRYQAWSRDDPRGTGEEAQKFLRQAKKQSREYARKDIRADIPKKLASAAKFENLTKARRRLLARELAKLRELEPPGRTRAEMRFRRGRILNPRQFGHLMETSKGRSMPDFFFNEPGKTGELLGDIRRVPTKDLLHWKDFFGGGGLSVARSAAFRGSWASQQPVIRGLYLDKIVRELIRRGVDTPMTKRGLLGKGVEQAAKGVAGPLGMLPKAEKVVSRRAIFDVLRRMKGPGGIPVLAFIAAYPLLAAEIE